MSQQRNASVAACLGGLAVVTGIAHSGEAPTENRLECPWHFSPALARELDGGRRPRSSMTGAASLPWLQPTHLTLTDQPTVNFGILTSFQDEGGDGAAPPPERAEGGGGDLAAAAQNPIASSISVPFENTLRFHSGVDDETSYVLNFQPVIPVKLNDEWNLINRPIIPIMYVPGFVDGIPGIGGEPAGFDDAFGLGDINYTAFLSPSNSEGLIWGLGPSLTLPTATDDALGSGKWSAGPSFVGLVIRKPVLAGVLVRHIWSFAGDSDRRSVNQSMLQPFINYNLEDGWYLMTAPVFTYDWAADSNRWSIPLGGGVGRLMTWGDQPVNMNLQLYYDLEHTDTSSDFQLKFVFQLLFPN
ncbi:MAG: neuromedin U [Planctomycetota bacterium]|jgi:hypothetical protein